MPKVDHTSPPWRVEQYRDSGRGPYVDIVADDPCLPDKCEGDCTVPCSMTERIGSTQGGDGRPDVCEANARLMVAAPELLDWLEYAHKMLCQHPDYCEANHPILTPEHDAIRAAIAKAKGETDDPASE